MKNKDKQKEINVQNFVAGFYENVRYKKEYSKKFHDFWFGRMLSMVEPRGRILDNGCGTGELMAFIRTNARTENVAELIGCDISENMIEFAKKRADRVCVADSESLPFDNQYFDVVYVRALLHHLQNIPKAVSEITRVLKPGGWVIFAETNKNLLNILPRKMAKKWNHFSDDHQNLKDTELVNAIKKELLVGKVEYLGYLGYFLLGFPDIIDVYKFVPFKKIFTPLLIKFDLFLSRIPVVKKLAFCIMISAKKSEK